MKYKDGSNNVEHTSQFQSLVNKLVTMKMNIDDKIANYAPGGIVTIDIMKDNLLNEEARRKENGESSFGTLVLEKQERSGIRQSRNARKYRGRSKSKKKKNSIKWYHYNKLDHMKKECRIWKKEQNEWTKNKRKKNEEETNTIATKMMLSLFVMMDMLAAQLEIVIG